MGHRTLHERIPASQLEMTSIRAVCAGLRLCAKTGRRHKAHSAIRSFQIPRRLSGSKRNMQDVLSALRHYNSRFPHDTPGLKKALWRAVRSLTPRHVPSPAFDKLCVDNVPLDLDAADAPAHVSGKMSILHRLYHNGYGEAARALDVLREGCPGTSHQVPAGYPAGAEAILRAVRGTNTGTTRASLQTLRAAAIVALVASEEWHLGNVWSFIQSRRPDLEDTLHLVADFRGEPTRAPAHQVE